MTQIYASKKNLTDITCKLVDLDTTYSYSDRSVDWYYNNQRKGTVDLGAYVSEGGSWTATGLLPNTTYTIEALIYKNDRLFMTLTAKATTDWEWYYPKTAGTNFNLTSDEWIDFCNKINKVRISKGKPNYLFTLDPDYIAQNKDFYWWMFYQASDAISDISTQVAPQCLDTTNYIKSGQPIYAWYFENLKLALNGVD